MEAKLLSRQLVSCDSKGSPMRVSITIVVVVWTSSDPVSVVDGDIAYWKSGA